MGIIAAIQTPSVYLDFMACAQRAAERIAEAAEHGAWTRSVPAQATQSIQGYWSPHIP